MKTNVVETSQWERELQVEVEAGRIQSELTKAYQDYQKRVEIPGFRKGKVPLRVIKARYGDSIHGRVVYDLLPELLAEATREAGLVAAVPPTIAELDAEPGQDLKFTAHVNVWPEIDVEHYEDLEITRPVHAVTDEEVDKQLEQLRLRQATQKLVERPLQKGDVLIADLQRLDESGLPIIGEKYENRRFWIGEEESPSPEFEEALLGITAGQERDVRFTYREDLPDQSLAGSTAHFRVTAREVHEHLLPELDDEFAKDVGEQFDSLEALRKHVRTQLERQWDMAVRERVRNQLMQRLVAANPFELPASLVQHYVRSMRERQQRIRQNQEGRAQPEDTSEPTEQERRQAEQGLRSLLLMEGLRRILDIRVDDEELETYLQERAEVIGVKIDDLKASDHLEDFRRELEDNRVFDILVQKAKITEETV